MSVRPEPNEQFVLNLFQVFDFLYENFPDRFDDTPVIGHRYILLNIITDALPFVNGAQRPLKLLTWYERWKHTCNNVPPTELQAKGYELMEAIIQEYSPLYDINSIIWELGYPSPSPNETV